MIVANSSAQAPRVRSTKAEAPRRRANLAAHVAIAPGAAIFFGVFIGCTVFSVLLSFTASRMFPSFEFVGLDQYSALFRNSRWRQDLSNIAVFGPVLVLASIVLGTLMAILIDQKVRGEALLRSLFLYPYATSFIVTGLLWRWFFDPDHGFERTLAHAGLPTTGINWLSDKNAVLYALVVAGVWHASGLVMVLMLAGLRGVDDDIWKAARIDGAPAWRTYVSIILPMLTAPLATCLVLLSISVVKVYDLVVAMTKGGPGFYSDMPAKFVMDNLFERQNVGLASAGTVVMLVTVFAMFAPFVVWGARRGLRKAR